ncbi:6046_t:CDS:2, partial [Dentiscutata heterogama]
MFFVLIFEPTDNSNQSNFDIDKIKLELNNRKLDMPEDVINKISTLNNESLFITPTFEYYENEKFTPNVTDLASIAGIMWGNTSLTIRNKYEVLTNQIKLNSKFELKHGVRVLKLILAKLYLDYMQYLVFKNYISLPRLDISKSQDLCL